MVSGRVGLNLAHGVAVVEVLAAVGAEVELEVGDDVGAALEGAPEVLSHAADSGAVAGGTMSDLSLHGLLLHSPYLAAISTLKPSCWKPWSLVRTWERPFSRMAFMGTQSVRE